MAGKSAFRVAVRVTPGASRVHVGGTWAPTGRPPALRVFVTERAVDGSATRAVGAAVAAAFGVRPADVEVISGHTSRTKVLLIDPAPLNGESRLIELLDG